MPVLIAQINLDESSDRTIAGGSYTFDRSADGVLVVPALAGFPGTPQAGELFWNTSVQNLYRRNSANTAWDAVEAESYTAYQLLGEVRKGSSGTIAKGRAVYLSGYNVGGWAEVEEARSDSASTMPAIGITNEVITNTSTGKVVVSGEVNDVDTSSWSVGDPLYVSSTTAGALTNVKPTGATNLIQKVAIVGKSDASTGGFEVYGAGRANDVPNIQEDYVWRGDSDGVATPTKMVFGDEWQTDEDDTLRSTTIQPPSWYAAHTFNTGTLPAGTYRVGWFFTWAIDSIADDFLAQVVVDGTTTLLDMAQEAKDAGTDQKQPSSGFGYATFATETTHSIVLQIATESGDDSHVHLSRFELWRIS